MTKLLVAINILLILIGSYFLFESIKYNNFYNSLKKEQPEQVNINFYKKGKYEFKFSNDITTKYTRPYFSLAMPVSKANFLRDGGDSKIKTLGCRYRIYNANNKQVFSKELEFNDMHFVKTTNKQSLLHLGSIKWLPDGKYKIIFNVSSPCSDNSFRNYKLLFMRHIAFGELLGIIFWYQLFGVCCFIGGIIFYVFRSLFCRRAKCSVE